MNHPNPDGRHQPLLEPPCFLPFLTDYAHNKFGQFRKVRLVLQHCHGSLNEMLKLNPFGMLSHFPKIFI